MMHRVLAAPLALVLVATIAAQAKDTEAARRASLEAALWALGYWLLGALPNFSEAFYFSLVTFTTLGYGDVTLSEEWRMLGALEAANGIVMFGWTTALITNVARHLFFRDLPAQDS